MQTKPIVNILCRTHNRPTYFKICYDSIKKQTYSNYTFIVGSDSHCNYYSKVQKLVLDKRVPDYIPQGMYHAPHNLHLNQLQKSCVTGWCLALDDDDMFVDENSLQTMVDSIDNENQLLIWKVQITPTFIVPSYSFGQQITPCDISGIGFMYHNKHNPVDWGFLSMGDYRVAKQLEAKGLELKWIDKILTRTQKGSHNGR